LAVYEDYLRADGAPDSGLEDARSKLNAFVDHLVETKPLVEPAVSPRVGFFERMRAARGLRFGWVAAAAVIVVVAVVWLQRGVGPEGLVLRGEGGTHHAKTLELYAPETVDQTQIRLSWAEHPGADAYDVRVYSLSQGEVKHLESVTDTTIAFFISDLSPVPAPGSQLLWSVTATKKGDDLLDSAPGTITIP